MKTIGLIGGMSWESSALYYRQINLAVQQRLGGLHSAQLVLVSVDFFAIEALQRAGDWSAAGEILADAARRIIFEELCLGQVHEASRQAYRRTMASLVAQGAGAIILGCTEISLLVDAADASVPLFDTTALHAVAAAEWALG